MNQATHPAMNLHTLAKGYQGMSYSPFFSIKLGEDAGVLIGYAKEHSNIPPTLLSEIVSAKTREMPLYFPGDCHTCSEPHSGQVILSKKKKKQRDPGPVFSGFDGFWTQLCNLLRPC